MFRTLGNLAGKSPAVAIALALTPVLLPAEGAQGPDGVQPSPVVSAAPALSQNGSDAGAPCRQALVENHARWPEPLPAPFQAARLWFVKGRCLQGQGRHAEAFLALERGLARVPGLVIPWRLRLFQSSLATGNHDTALVLLGEILAQQPPEEVATALREILTGWLALRGGAEVAAQQRFLATYLTGLQPVREDLALIRHLHALAQESGQAGLVSRLEGYLWMLPEDDASAGQWAGVPATLAKTGQIPESGAWGRRARALFRLRLLPRLIAELEQPWVKIPDPQEARRVGGYYFKGLIRRRHYEKAALRIGAVEVRKRFALDEQEALWLGIRIDLGGHRVGGALRKLQTWLAAGFPRDRLPEIYLKLARHYERREDLKGVSRWGERLLAEFPDHPLAALGFWLPFWNFYRAGDHAQAAVWADRAIANAQAFDPEQRAAFFYWRARIHSAQGNHAAARDMLAALEKLWPTSFYGLMAALPDGKNPAAPHFAPAKRPRPPKTTPPGLKAIHEVPALQRALFLMVVGEDELAAGELGRIIGTPMAEAVLRELGELFAFFDRYRLQFRLTANYYYNSLKRQPVADTPLWRYAFPQAFWDVVAAQTENNEISPFFVLAIMREESHYDVKAGSTAGARGLMQLMPDTARMVARRNRMPFEDAGLEKPEVNITLGTLYLKRVLNRFNWNPIHAAAAYNAGPNTVRRWTKKMGHLPADEFIESIPYDETRAYVKRVIAAYLIYRQLY